MALPSMSWGSNQPLQYNLNTIHKIYDVNRQKIHDVDGEKDFLSDFCLYISIC